jgi:TusA-related sulfurtransferase
MEIDLRDMVWPVSVIQCNEALTRLEPGDDLTITVSDPDVFHNIVLLINSRTDLRFDQCRKSDSYQLNVHRLATDQRTGAESNPSKDNQDELVKSHANR